MFNRINGEKLFLVWFCVNSGLFALNFANEVLKGKPTLLQWVLGNSFIVSAGVLLTIAIFTASPESFERVEEEEAAEADPDRSAQNEDVESDK